MGEMNENDWANIIFPEFWDAMYSGDFRMVIERNKYGSEAAQWAFRLESADNVKLAGWHIDNFLVSDCWSFCPSTYDAFDALADDKKEIIYAAFRGINDRAAAFRKAAKLAAKGE